MQSQIEQQLERLDVLAQTLQPGLIALVIAMIVAEIVLLKFKGQKLNHKSGAVSLLSGLFVFGLEALADVVFYFSVCYWLYHHRLMELGFGWHIWLLCFVLYDLMFYVSHRLQHEVRLLWCFHTAHHTTEEMRLSSAVRGSMFDFIYNPPFFIWMCLLGIHPLMFIAVRSISRVWGVLEHIHPSLVGKLPLLNKVLVTPDVHRVHHGKNIQYLDRNYGEILSVWDRLFGTYEEYHEPPVYGILKPIDAENFFAIQFQPLKELLQEVKREKKLINKIKLMLKPPGWSADGNHTTAKTLRKHTFARQL